MGWNLKLILAILSSPILGACVAAGPGPDTAAPALSPTPAEELVLRALREQRDPPVVTDALDPPPGAAVSALARVADERRANRTRAEVLGELLAVTPDPEPAPELAAAAVTDEDRDAAVRLYLAGREAAMDGLALMAVTRLEQARQRDPGSTAIVRELAHAYAVVPNPAKMTQAFAALLAIDPTDSEALFAMTLAAGNRRDYEEAVTLLARAWASGSPLEHDPAAEILGQFILHEAFLRMGYERASIEAGRDAVSVHFPAEERTVYGRQIASLYRRRGEIWRSIGDAQCRLGAYRGALDAYDEAAQLPLSDPGSLVVRNVYANLCLGRPWTAQLELYAALSAAAPDIGDREVRLCEYLAAAVEDRALLVDAMRELAAKHGESDSIARATALLLPRAEAIDVLRSFVNARPRDLGAVGQLLRWLGARDPAAAIDLAASLLAENQPLAAAYVDRLLVAIDDPARVFAVPSPDGAAPRGAAHVQIRARMLARLGGLGEAWSCCLQGLETCGEDRGLLLTLIELAGLLDEPVLIDDACRRAGAPTDAWSWIVRANAYRATEQYGRARDAAEAAQAAAGDDVDLAVTAALVRARAYAEEAAPMMLGDARAAQVQEAERIAEEAHALDATREEPLEFLATLFAPQGPMADLDRFRAAVAELNRVSPESRFYARVVVQDAIQRGRFDEALERALALFDADGTDRESLTLAIVAWGGMDRSEDAIRWLRDAYEERPGDPLLLDMLVRLLVSDERTAEALEILETRRASGVNDPAVRALLEITERSGGRTRAALALGEERLAARPVGTRRVLQEALLYAQSERPATALERLEWIADHERDASERHLTAAIGVCSRLDDLDGKRDEVLVRLVTTTTGRFAGTSLTIYALGLRALVRMADEGAAFDRLAADAARRGRGADDGSMVSVLRWRDLAQGLVDDGHPGAAARALRRRLHEGEPLADDAAANLAVTILAAEASASADLSESIALVADLEARGVVPPLLGVGEAPSRAALLSSLSQVYALLGDDAGSEQLLRESIRLDPSDAMVMNNLGYMRVEAGHEDPETIGWVERAAALAGDDPNVLDTLAWLRYKQGRFDTVAGTVGAAPLLRRVLEVSEQPSAEVLDHYGDALWRLGRADDAIRSWRAAVMILEDPERRNQIVRTYLLVQQQVWGLVVADPRAMYHRDYGVVLERVQAKLAAADAEEVPSVAPTFAERSGADENQE